MRNVIVLDKKISNTAFEAWKKEDIAFWEKYLGITPSYAVMRYDFSTYPTFVDSDGDIRPTNAYLQSVNDLVTGIHGQFDVDFILVAIHQDNWRSDPDGPNNGIWGTNYSYVFGKQTLQYCRWGTDKEKTFGTIYHERHHSFDAMIHQELGLRVEPILGVAVGKYDYCVTHGKCPPWEYIRRKENTASLTKMKPLLLKMFAERRRKYFALEAGEENVVMRFIHLLEYVLRMKFNMKDGIKRT
jgi:hypothetical protein